VKLEDGMLVELGREQAKAPIRMRLQRFVEYYPTLSDARHGRPVAVDMRYPNGFALRFRGQCGSRSQRKEMSRDSKDLIVGLDIGTSKIVALVAESPRKGGSTSSAWARRNRGG
jgi:hypothetical protein